MVLQAASNTQLAENATRQDLGGLRTRIVVVGFGMSAFGLCDRIARRSHHADFAVTVIGDEPTIAYDRVNLSKYFSGADRDELKLATESWYRERDIRTVTGRRVVRIDREQQVVYDDRGDEYSYDKLVLATGSRAWVPPIPGADSPGVFVYRTLEDLERIKNHVQSTKASVGAVIGGGLLGLEAAKVLHEFGLKTSVIEMAPGLMPRQLDSEGAKLLRQQVESLGVDVHVVRRTEEISVTDDDRIRLKFENASTGLVDILIIAAGIRPNDQLAEPSGLNTGPRGGFAVDEGLRTSDPNIYAIGECVSFRDHVYGLVAPCYRMADVLADRIAGIESTFQGADESAELKLMGVPVVTLGQTIGETSNLTDVTFQNESGYRKLLLARGKVVGAMCVGEWEQLSLVRQAIESNKFLWPWQRNRFARTGGPWLDGEALSVRDWSPDSVVCACLGVRKGVIDQTVREWSDADPLTVDGVANACGASTACGSCRSLVAELTSGDPVPTRVAGAVPMLIASVVSITVLVLLPFVPELSFARSVQSTWRSVDFLWRDDVARQVTGFSLLSIVAIGMLFSLRKRFSWMTFGSYALWRSIHGVLGSLALLFTLVHTGLRLGQNLNLLLSLCFLSVIAVGALAGFASAIENRFSGPVVASIRVWRRRLSTIHLWVTWPLPALIALHILSFYWFTD